MTTSRIIEILNYPDAALVKHCIDRANLTAQELQILELREFQNKSIEASAELLMLSDSTVKRRYRDAISKLDVCWSGLPWIIDLKPIGRFKQ